MIRDGILYVDNSTLRIVAECSTAALVRYFHGYTSPDDRAELRAGSAIHAALAAYLDPAQMQDANDVLAAEYRDWAEEHVAAGERLSWPNVSRIIAGWLDDHPLSSLPFIVKRVEIGFAFMLADDIAFCGRIDAEAEMRQQYGGGRVVIEHKSTGNVSPWWIAQFKLGSQVTGYEMGLRSHPLGDDVVGSIVNAIELKKLPSSDRKCEKHATAYSECGHMHVNHQMIGPIGRTAAQLLEWQKTALHLARRWQNLLTTYPKISDIARVRMQGMFNGACRGCPLNEWCGADRQESLMPTMLAHEPWSPYPIDEAAPHA